MIHVILHRTLLCLSFINYEYQRGCYAFDMVMSGHSPTLFSSPDCFMISILSTYLFT